MARVKLNSLLADLRGRLQSVVFSSNSSGFYVKIHKNPTNPQTVGQSAQRYNFTRLVKSWNLLTPEEREPWTDYAAQADNIRYDWFGDPYYPSSRSQFTIVNMARLQASEDITVTAPTGNLPEPLPDFSAGVDPQTVNLTTYLDPGAAFDASIAYIHASLCCVSSPARMTPILPLKFLALRAYDATWPWEFNDLVLSIYGSIPTSGRWFIELVPYSATFRSGTTLRLTALMGEEVTP